MLIPFNPFCDFVILGFLCSLQISPQNSSSPLSVFYLQLGRVEVFLICEQFNFLKDILLLLTISINLLFSVLVFAVIFLTNFLMSNIHLSRTSGTEPLNRPPATCKDFASFASFLHRFFNKS